MPHVVCPTWPPGRVPTPRSASREGQAVQQDVLTKAEVVEVREGSAASGKLGVVRRGIATSRDDRVAVSEERRAKAEKKS